MNEFVLDASFSLNWCFEGRDAAIAQPLLETLQNNFSMAWVPDIWQFEILNGLGKGIARNRVDPKDAKLFWELLNSLPIRMINVLPNLDLLSLSIIHNLAIYDACYLRLALDRGLALATFDKKLQRAAVDSGVALLQLNEPHAPIQ